MRIPIFFVLVTAFIGLSVLSAGLLFGITVYVARDTVIELVRDKLDVVLGLVADRIDPDLGSAALSRSIDEAAVVIGGVAFILDENGLIIAHPMIASGVSEPGPPEQIDLTISTLMSGESSKLSDERFQVWFADVEGVVMGMALYPLGRPPGWKLGIYVSTPPVLSLKGRMWTLLVIAGVVITLSILISVMFARALSRPLQALALVAKKIGRFELDVDPLPESRLLEIHETDATVNSMVEGLRWFARYVPRQLVRRLMGRLDVDQAETRQLTILFTDMAGFTSMSENMSAEEVAEFINHHLSLVSACIEAEGGTVDKYIGDSVMAFFGAPEPQSDHASRACHAALAIRTAVEVDNAERSASNLRTTRVRIGIHTGPVVVGNIGSEDRVNYTIIGDAVNVASRLESSGKELGDLEADVGILASGEVITAADLSGQAQAVGRYRLRGRSEETEVFRL